MDSLKCAKKNQINGQREIHRFYAAKLAEIPICNANDSASGWNRYDTDNQHVLHVWTDGKSYDIAVPKEDQARELGDGEPSPPSESGTIAETLECLYVAHRTTDGINKAITAAISNLQKFRESGAAQEVSPEHILRNLLAVIHRDGGHYATEHGLEKAGEYAQALVLKERVEPSPEPDAFQAAWAEYSKGGHGALGWEKIAFTCGFGEGFKAGRSARRR